MKEFNLSKRKEDYYNQLREDLKRVFNNWECPVKFREDIREQVGLFFEMITDLDEEFIRRLKEEIRFSTGTMEREDVIFLIDTLVGEKLTNRRIEIKSNGKAWFDKDSGKSIILKQTEKKGAKN